MQRRELQLKDTMRYVLLFVLATGSLSCRRSTEAAAADASVKAPVAGLGIPHVHAPIKIDGEADEPEWLKPARTGPFVERGGKGPARPYSDARLLWDETALYLILYAADENIRAPTKVHDVPLLEQDAFRVVLTSENGRRFIVDIAASGAVSDGADDGRGGVDLGWESGLRVAVDLDGSLNADDGEEDEEWVVEAAIPWKVLGVTAKAGTTLGFTASRCDTPKDGKRRCGAWGESGGGVMVLEK